jgi:hypothetical protein
MPATNSKASNERRSSALIDFAFAVHKLQDQAPKASLGECPCLWLTFPHRLLRPVQMPKTYNLRPRKSPIADTSATADKAETTARKCRDPTRVQSKTSMKENLIQGRPIHSKSFRKRDKSPVVLAERPYKRQRGCDALQTEVHELRVEVKELRHRCEVLQSRSQSHWERAQHHQERAKCHRERSQDDMKAIQGTVGGTKVAIASAITGVKTVLNGLGVGRAAIEDNGSEHTNKSNKGSAQPLSYVFLHSICALIPMWTTFTVVVVLLPLANSEINFEIKNRAPTVRDLLCKVVTSASEPMPSNTM